MATRKQRSLRHARRLHHNRTQRARLRAALRSIPAVASMPEMRKHMAACGYVEGDRPGTWRRDYEPPPLKSAQSGMTWEGVQRKRLFKLRRRKK